MNRHNVTALACLTGLAAAALLVYSPVRVPARPVAPLNLESFRAAFNASADRTRVVALFSPT